MNDIWEQLLNSMEDTPKPAKIKTNVIDSTVYLIITDLHLSYKNKNSRIDYLSENRYCIRKINEIIDEYVKRNNKVNLIFLGDVTDCSFKDQSKAIEVNNIIVDFKKRVNECYFVIGNHETTYYKDNPLWSLFNSIESPSLNQVIKRSCKPQGILPLGRVVDVLEDGDVKFYFNHYDTPIQTPKPGTTVNIGLFHKDILCNAIINDAKINHDTDLYVDKTIHFDEESVFDNYDYAFMGHLHSVYGKWSFDGNNHTEIYYLASLGRTNHKEVSNDFLERDIPAVIIKDGEFQKIESNHFNLMTREECVTEEIVKKQQMIRESSKENKEMLESFSPMKDDPLDNIVDNLRSSPPVQEMFKAYITNNSYIFEDEIVQKLEELKWV